MSLNGEEKCDILTSLSTGSFDQIKRLIDVELEIANINAPLNFNNDTALHHSARYGTPEILKFLLDRGANVNSVNIKAETPLVTAIKSNQKENALCLIHHGADVNSVDKDGCSVLIAACQKGLEDIVQELLIKDVNVNYRDHLGWTALIWSISSLKRKSYVIIKMLLDANADVGQKYSVGTAYEYANNLYCYEVAQLISEYEDKSEERVSDWDYLKDQIQNKWTLTRDIANILDKCNSLKALDFVLEQKKLDLVDFISQTPEEINKLPTMAHRKERLNRILRDFHLQQWNTQCLGPQFINHVCKQKASALAQMTFLASMGRQIKVMAGNVSYIYKNMCPLTENDKNKMLPALEETRDSVLLLKIGLTELLQTAKEDGLRPPDWIHSKPYKGKRSKQTLITGIAFTMSVVFVCWEGHKLLRGILTFPKSSF